MAFSFNNIYEQKDNVNMQWRIQSLSVASIPIWAPKLGAKLKENWYKTTSAILSYLQRPQTFKSIKTLKNMELKTLSMP